MQANLAIPSAKIGMRIRKRRVQKGVTQAFLGAEIGVSFQQIQKYEAGINCISASRLYRIARSLQCPVDSLFPSPARPKLKGNVQDRFASPDIRKLIKNFQHISDPKARRKFLELCRVLGQSPK